MIIFSSISAKKHDNIYPAFTDFAETYKKIVEPTEKINYDKY
jgi:hypothetical protein